MNVSITNASSELSACRKAWTLDETYHAWCLEDLLYTQKATTPLFQRLSIFVPEAYMNADGTVHENGVCGTYTAKNAPVVFENRAAGYMQMPHTWLGGPADEAPKYLERGMVYVSCGCRGRDSEDPNGVRCGKSPWTLVDFKTAIRFLRHNADALPGDLNHIISVGWSAGGAMSALIGVTGDNEDYLPYLQENGAFMDESDAVYAAQIYCPIIDLEHADAIYEWQFREDREYEDSPAGPAGVLTPYSEALSAELSDRGIAYFNSLGLYHPDTGEVMRLGADGRSGNAYDYLMDCLNDSATKYLRWLAEGKLPADYSPRDYISGNYMRDVHAPKLDAGPAPTGDSFSLGMMMLRPPKGEPVPDMTPQMVKVPGDAKEAWLTWDGAQAKIRDLDTYLLHYRRRLKPCPSFDTLGADSGENQEFGTPQKDCMHFSTLTGDAVHALVGKFPEADRFSEAWKEAEGDEALNRRIYLINPLNFIGTEEVSTPAEHFRIRVGATDADTSFLISMVLSVKLQNAGMKTDYALVWEQSHCEADYPGEICDWIEDIVRG